jgi:hypothetical protein
MQSGNVDSGGIIRTTIQEQSLFGNGTGNGNPNIIRSGLSVQMQSNVTIRHFDHTARHTGFFPIQQQQCILIVMILVFGVVMVVPQTIVIRGGIDGTTWTMGCANLQSSGRPVNSTQNSRLRCWSESGGLRFLLVVVLFLRRFVGGWVAVVLESGADSFGDGLACGTTVVDDMDGISSIMDNGANSNKDCCGSQVGIATQTSVARRGVVVSFSWTSCFASS